jgi:dolichol-phosphate mannosyltransferase
MAALTLSVLIPAYQEEATIGRLVTLVRQIDLSALGVQTQIVVVDDGSTDGTALAAARAAGGHPRFKLIRHRDNRGKGRAIRTALRHATGQYCIIQDADLEYSVEDYPALVRAMLGGAEVVYGSRFLDRRWPQGMRLANLVCNRLLTWTANALYRLSLTDEATCFKMFRTRLLRELRLECERFEFCTEVTAKLGRCGLSIVEVPVRYCARSVSTGKKIRWTDAIAAFASLIQWRFAS